MKIVQQSSTAIGRGLEHICQQRLRNLNLPRLTKSRLRKDLIALLNYLMVSYRKDQGRPLAELHHKEKEAMTIG